MFKILPATTQQSGIIAQLAKPIWEEHYEPIIGLAQVEYMLDKFQSETAIAKQMQQGYQYFLVELEQQLVGYFSLQTRENALFISKFYLSANARGKGLGKHMLSFIENKAQTENLEYLELTVNKYNSAYQVYLALGFAVSDSVVVDIGNGYVMDDYVMQKPISTSRVVD